MVIKFLGYGILLCLLSAPLLNSDQPYLYMRFFDGLQQYFTEHIETALVFFDDGKAFLFTYFDEVKTAVAVEYMEERGYPISRAVLVIHNHMSLSRFSQEDRNAYYRMKAMGFRGIFALRIVTGKIIPFKASLPKGWMQ